MSDKFNVGDNVFNAEYLDFIGRKDKWLNMNMKPISKVMSVGNCRVWIDLKRCFSTEFSDVTQASNIPQNMSRIFDQESGFDCDRRKNKLLHCKKDRLEIVSAIDIAIKKSVDEVNSQSALAIESLNRKIEQIKKEQLAHSEFCAKCKSDIIAML